MLTFLRKIRKSLIDSGNARRYFIYALGEITLVVIGILIALQINNWNEWRKERQIEKIVLEDIKDNIIRNTQLIETTLQNFDQINRSTSIIRDVTHNKAANSDTLHAHFYNSIKHGGFMLRLNFDGYESLKNIGFGIIQNEVLKDQILSLFEVVYNNYAIELHWGNSVYVGSYGWWKKYFYKTQNDEFIPIDYNKIINSKSYLSEINELASVRTTLQNTMKDCLTQNHLVLQLIKEELGEK